MRVLQVGELASLIKAALVADPQLQDAYVEAELGDCHLSSAGHWYFNLKDSRTGGIDRSVLKAAMFRKEARGLKFEPHTGMRVLAHGSVSVYAAAGSLQLYLDQLEPQGVGALALAFQQLVARLEAEGLFATQRKRPLPFLPRRLAVVTSRHGAALRDVIHVVQRRCPITQVVVAPTLVQGDGAVPEILAALELAGRADVEVVLLVRGGGSLEDLQAFNSEAVARAIIACPLPVVVGVGHETDTSVADFVADRRAPTPSVAAELAVPDLAGLRVDLSRRSLRLRRGGESWTAGERRRLELTGGRLARLAPAMRLASGRIDLDLRQQRLAAAVHRLLAVEQRGLGGRVGLLQARGPERRLLQAREEFSGRVGRLEALSPMAVLARGYSITLDEVGGGVLRDAERVAVGATISTRLLKGRLLSRVSEVRPEAEGGSDGP
ncbi:MAG TPA: exodeoxyribonuclease VII large subunit [Candidatus Dormibacteraeota bacterium]|nr:exodeoxyribonuclease VII large subunit [Candidatus Dormibacteraeota bacterium]